MKTPVRFNISLFWRTFLMLGLLLLGSVVAWFQTFRMLEEEPRTVLVAEQLASLVNLTRAALIYSDSIGRVSLINTLADEENVHISVREPSDTFARYSGSRLSLRLHQAVTSKLGRNSIVASRVNGKDGLWIGFDIGNETYWLLIDPERLGTVGRTTWLIWLAIALGVSLLGAAVLAGLINRPLKQLSLAAAKVREGDFQGSHLDEHVSTTEIREVNLGFNQMAEKLGKAESDRTLMLAGISHDLRTPLARLRLEAEMSVSDETARELMAADIEQVTGIIDKFLDYARAHPPRLEPVDLKELIQAAAQPLSASGVLQVNCQVPEATWVLADAIDLRRVVTNLLENAMRYGRGTSDQAHVDITLTHAAPARVNLSVRDHGNGAPPEALPHLTEPFYRADEARTAATGSGLGLAIAEKTLTRMGGRLHVQNHPKGGLDIQITLQAG